MTIMREVRKGLMDSISSQWSVVVATVFRIVSRRSIEKSGHCALLTSTNSDIPEKDEISSEPSIRPLKLVNA